MRRTEPSSQPRARIVEAGLEEIDHMGPPWEPSERCQQLQYRVVCSKEIKHTFTLPCSMSHSMSSLPPPALNSRRLAHEGISSCAARLGERKVSARDSTLDCVGPTRVCTVHASNENSSRTVQVYVTAPFGLPMPEKLGCGDLSLSTRRARCYRSRGRRLK